MSHITEPNATIRSASLMKDAFGQVVTIMETYKRFDAETKTVMFGANTSFLQDNFEIIGLLDGKEIFKYNNNDVCVVKKALVKIPWRNIIKGIKNAFGAFSFVYTLWEIYQELRSKQTVTGHPIYVMGEDGRLYVVGHEVIITYDPVSFPANINDKEYQIDSIQFRFERKYDEPRIKPMYTKVGEQITLYNIPYIDIEDILAE